MWMLLELLARMAEKAQSLTELLAIDTPFGAEGVDAVAVLPGAAASRADTLDAVGEDHGAVIGDLPAMHQNAAIAAVGDGVAVDLQLARLDRIDAGIGRAADFRALDAAGHALQRQTVLAAAEDAAIVDDQMLDAGADREGLAPGLRASDWRRR